MPRFQPGFGTRAKHRGETLQWHLNIAETDTVTDTQCDFPYPNPAIVAVQKCSIARMVILHIDQTVPGQFNMGMQAGHCGIIEHEI